MLLDDRLNDEDRHALHVAAQALRHVLDAAFRGRPDPLPAGMDLPAIRYSRSGCNRWYRSRWTADDHTGWILLDPSRTPRSRN